MDTQQLQKIHTLKIKHKYLTDVVLGIKTFELRKNDRNFQVGDAIQFIDIDFTSPTGTPLICPILYGIVYILEGVPEYGLSSDYCILGIRPLSEVSIPDNIYNISI